MNTILPPGSSAQSPLQRLPAARSPEPATGLAVEGAVPPAQTPSPSGDANAVGSAFPGAAFLPSGVTLGETQAIGAVAAPSRPPVESFQTFLQRLEAPADLGYIPLEDAKLKDGLNQFLGSLRTQLAERPELREKLAQSTAGQGLLAALDGAANGQLDSNAVIQIQTFIAASGIDIGYSDNSLGVDGDYGPLTHMGLQQAFANLLEQPDQALAGLSEREAGIVQNVRDSRPAISDVVPATPLSESDGSIVSTPYQDKNGNPVRLNPAAAQGLTRIQDLARAKGIEVRINSSYRSVEEQTRLWRDALAKYGSAEEARRWVAPPGRSRHNSGGAIDMNLMRNGQKIPQSEFDALIREAGMYRPMAWEGWHVEPLGSRRA